MCDNAFRSMELVNVKAAALACDHARRFGSCFDITARDLTGPSVNLCNEHYFRPQALQHRRPRVAVPGRHCDNQGVPQCGASNREASTHVSARHLDDWHARPQATILARGKQDSLCCPILHTSARLKELRLRNNATTPAVYPIQGNERGISDETDCRCDEHAPSRR
jgi:hypothetical protein